MTCNLFSISFLEARTAFNILQPKYISFYIVVVGQLFQSFSYEFGHYQIPNFYEYDEKISYALRHWLLRLILPELFIEYFFSEMIMTLKIRTLLFYYLIHQQNIWLHVLGQSSCIYHLVLNYLVISFITPHDFLGHNRITMSCGILNTTNT